MPEGKELTGYPSVDKPWLKYYKTIHNSNDIPSLDCSMVDFLYQCNKDRLGNTALNYYGTRITFERMFVTIDQVAAALRACGICKGDVVTLCALNTPEFVYLLYALNKIGAISNWVGLTSPCEDLHNQLVSTDSRVVFTISIAYYQITEAAKGSNVERIITVPIEGSMPALLRIIARFKGRGKGDQPGGIQWHDFLKNAHDTTENDTVAPNDIAVIAYTGGSTGVPKGVMLSNYAINSHYRNFNDTNKEGIFSFRERDKMIAGVPYFLVFGLCACCHSPLCHSMELVLAPDPSPSAGVDLILRNKVQHVMGGRLLIEELLSRASRQKARLDFITMIMYGGEETNKTWERCMGQGLKEYGMTAPILNSYGMSETSAGVLTAPDNDTDGLIPCANVVIKIVDPENEKSECTYGQEGELCISTAQLMLGYYKNKEETVEVIFEENGVRWLRTHDLATISREGIVKITGRIKRIYSRLTQDGIQIRVYPMRIEEAIRKHDLVRECAVVGVKDDVLAYRSIAYVILSEKTAESNAVKLRLGDYCRTVLPDSHWPDEYIIVEKFPITRAGKIDYRALEEMAKEM